MPLADQIIAAESGGNPNAANPNSSASGLGQFLDSTWLSTLAKHRPDLTANLSQPQLLALKSNPQLSREMTEAYATDNAQVLQRAGLPVNSGSLYLAHFAGPGGAVSLLNADPNASAASILGPAVVKANPFLARMTAGDLAKWATNRVGGAVPAQGSAPTGGTPAPGSMAPQGLLGGLASQPQIPAQGGQGLLDQAVDSELTKRLAAIPGLLAQQQQQPAPQPLQPLPQSPARQMAALTTPQMQMAMNSPAAMLRRQILAMMMQPGQQQQPQQNQAG